MSQINGNQQAGRIIDKSCINILKSAQFGRYLVASKDIEELSIVLSESPVTYGPGDDDQDVEMGEVPMCLGCCVRLRNDHRCSLCGWPACGVNCQNIEIHAQNECVLFREGNVTYPPPHTWPIINKSVLVLRCHLLKMMDKDSWENTICRLEHHTEIRYQKPYCVKGDEMLLDNVEYFLGRPLDDEIRNEIVRISGVINVNAFSTTNSHSNNRQVTMISQCIYQTASFFANSCVPNCTWRVGPAPTFQICVRSSVPIKKGQMITISYSPHDALCGTLQRQISNEDVAHFVCSCIRCQDPTELGTFISAVKCPSCTSKDDTKKVDLGQDQGFLLPLNPLLPESYWVCNSKQCDESQTVHKTFSQTYKIQQMFEAIQRAGLERSNEIQELERLLDIGKTIVHQNHYMLQDIRMTLVKRQIPILDYLDEEQLEHLIQHTKMLLNVANILAPGFSQIRALLQHFVAQGLRAQYYHRRCTKIDDENETETRKDCSNENSEIIKVIKNLETRALLFFQRHNYQSDNDRIIKNIKNALNIE